MNIPSRKKLFPCYFLALLYPFLTHLSVWKILWPSFQFRVLEPRGFLYVIMIQTGLLLTKRAVKNKNACWLISTVYIARCWQTSKLCSVCNFSVKDVEEEPFQQVKVHKLLQWKHLQRSWSPGLPHCRCKSLSRYISADTTNLKKRVWIRILNSQQPGKVTKSVSSLKHKIWRWLFFKKMFIQFNKK